MSKIRLIHREPCAEAGAIAAMIAAGEKEILEICIVADSPSPVSPCGGCRQKLAEFSQPSTRVHLANLHGVLESHTLGDLLPHSFLPITYWVDEHYHYFGKGAGSDSAPKEEINEFSAGLADGSVSDAQAAAFAMAVCLHGLSEQERVDLTLAMRDTGNVRIGTTWFGHR